MAAAVLVSGALWTKAMFALTSRRLTFRMYEQAQEKGLSTARCAAPSVHLGPMLMCASFPLCRRENSMRRDYDQAQAVMQVRT